MAHIWRTVRVFISSTFRDMHAERDHLVKVVFPGLRERLEKHRIYLIDVDLRWGVTREQAENDQALDLCLQQIDECRPFFIGILGERYGWVPTRYPADALKKFGWIQQHTGKSVTELEVLHGVLQNRQMRGRAFFYFRDPVAVHAVPEAIRRSVYADTDRALIDKLEDLKGQIRHSGYPVMENYPARWDPEGYDRPSRSHGRLVGLEAFGERVRDQLWQAIQEEFQLPEQPPVVIAADPLAEEQDYHERFMESRLRVYVGRDQINDALLAFADGKDLISCLVTGPSGSGKSAALAHFLRDYQHKYPQTLVIPHFIGASPRSTNLRDLLRRFCQIFKARFGFADDVPEVAAPLSVTFREFVGKVPADTRVLLVIDALNQLDEADRAQELYWLPTQLPPQVKVIVSCITDSGKPEPVLEAFRWRKHCPVQLAALGDTEQRLIIRQVPSLSAKTLDENQVRLLLSNPATANPLFLLVALEELRGFPLYERLNERIAAFPREGDIVTAIFTQVIERLAEEFNQKLVESVLTLLASARRGLSERELQALVADLDGADDLFPVLRQLRPYLLSRAGLIDFYHRNLFKAVRERYLPSEGHQRQAHVRLTKYFDTQDYWLESLEEQQRRARTFPPTTRPANVRKVDELPWQLLQAADWQKSEELLTDLPFLEAKAEAGMVFDLATDFSAVIGSMPADRPLLRILRLLEEALRRDIHFVARHPTTLFQCLWNSCWWYDCSDAAHHYESTERHAARPSMLGRLLDRVLPLHIRRKKKQQSSLLPSRQQFTLKLCDLIHRWRSTKEKETPGFLWIRSLRPPQVHLGAGQLAVLRGHQDLISDVAVSPDGHWLITGSVDKTVRVWDVQTGREVHRLHAGDKNQIRSVSMSPDGHMIVAGGSQGIIVWDAITGTQVYLLPIPSGIWSVGMLPAGRRIVAGTSDGTIRMCDMTRHVDYCNPLGDYASVPLALMTVAVSPIGRQIASSRTQSVEVWDVESGDKLHCLVGHENDVLALAYSPDGRCLGSAGFDKSIRLWDAETGKLLSCLRGHESEVRSLSFSPDGRRIAAGTANGAIWIWDSQAGEVLRRLREHEGVVSGVVWFPDGRRIASVGATDTTIRVWDTECSNELRSLRGHKWLISKVLFSPNGQWIITGSWDNTVRVWEVETGEERACLKGHMGIVEDILVSCDSQRLISSSRDGTVRLWQLDTGEPIACLGGFTDHANCVALSPGGRHIVSGSEDSTVRIWDAKSGREISCLRGHSSSITAVVYSPRGDRIVTASMDKTLRIWDTNGFAAFALLEGHKEGVRCIAFALNNRWIASGSFDCTVRVWDAFRGKEFSCLQGHSSSLVALAFSPNGDRLVSTDQDGSMYVWDVMNSRCIEIIEGNGDAAAIAAGISRFRWRVLARKRETVIESIETGKALAAFSGSLIGSRGDPQPIAHPFGRISAGAYENHLYCFKVEGEVQPVLTQWNR